MEYLAINRPRPNATNQRLDAALVDHRDWVNHGLQTGDLVRAGRWGRGGMCIIEAPDEAAATTILSGDPLVATGLVEVELAAIMTRTEPYPAAG